MKQLALIAFLIAFASVPCTGTPTVEEGYLEINGTSLFFKPYFADQSLVTKMDLTFTENTIKNSDAVAGLILESIGEFDLHEDLQAIHCPTLIIHGEADPMPIEYAVRIHESIPGSELVTVEGAGHWLFVDATDTFTSSILDFLARVEK